MNKVDIGEKKFVDFVKKIGLKSKMKTLYTKHYEELADLDGDLFVLKCIEHIYEEFYNMYIQIDFKGVDKDE